MENSIFLLQPLEQKTIIERFHSCSWEFESNTCLMEFGIEIDSDSVKENTQLNYDFVIPWVTAATKHKCLFPQLTEARNCKFIFNDSVTRFDFVDPNQQSNGIIFRFAKREKLTILSHLAVKSKSCLSVSINLIKYQEQAEKSNLYIRLCLEVDKSEFTHRKTGIGKTTIVYDTKVNERRNFPEAIRSMLDTRQYCGVNQCFLFNIVPFKYEMSFYDSSVLQSVRTLEYDSFRAYLGSIITIPKGELMVAFNKKKTPEQFSFFTIYTNERIGTGQFALAILINILCGILLFIPSYRNGSQDKTWPTIFNWLPVEIYCAVLLALGTIVYFSWPIIMKKIIGLSKKRNK